MGDPAQGDAAGRPGAFGRGRMRRRLRQQTRMREALLVDLGALVYELHRHGRREPELLQAKASELTVVDQEVRALTDALGAGEEELALVAAGIAGSCQHCGTLLSTDARYCSGCGAEAAPSLPGSAPAATESPVRRSDRDLDPEATGVIGRAQPEPEAFAEPKPVPTAESEPAAEPDPQPLDRDEPQMAPRGSEGEDDPGERAPWLTDEDEREPPAAEHPPRAEPQQAPPATRRRRSGGAVGKVAGLVRRPRDGG